MLYLRDRGISEDVNNTPNEWSGRFNQNNGINRNTLIKAHDGALTAYFVLQLTPDSAIIPENKQRFYYNKVLFRTIFNIIAQNVSYYNLNYGIHKQYCFEK